MPRSDLGVDFTFDYKTLEDGLNDVGKRAMAQAASRFLNNSAFEVRRALIAHTNKVFDKPTVFTRNAWLVNKAKPSDGERMTAEVFAKPKQAAYLYFTILGKNRHKGDPGDGPYDVFSCTSKDSAEAKLTRYGGVHQKAMRRFSKLARDEKKARKELRAKRKAAMHDKSLTPEQRRAYLWSVVSHNKPGVFFGTHDGVKGLGQRPQRYMTAPKTRGHHPVWTKNGDHLSLRFGVSDQSKGRLIFKYDEAVAAAFRQNFSAANFAKELDRQT